MRTTLSSIGRQAVEDLLYREAALLDSWQLDEWLSLYTVDARYCIPSTDKPDGDPHKDLVIVDDNRERLESRVERLKSRHAHREYPSSRTRHLVTNVMVESDDGERCRATAAFMVWRFRGTRADSYVGRYEFEIVTVDRVLRIRSKRATLDLITLDEAGAVSIIL
ncbi:MAG: aromatic-ring-hydroxylating dioxygenase subunit beta [Candidatus Elarobacter sp.]